MPYGRNEAIAIKTPAISVIEDGMIITVAARMRDTTTGRMPSNIAFATKVAIFEKQSRQDQDDYHRRKHSTSCIWTIRETSDLISHECGVTPTGPGVTWEIATTSIN